MTDKQFIRKYCRMAFPVGTEVHDSARNTHYNGPYVINKRTVFEIYPWTAEDYNDLGRPEDPEDYDIDILVRNPGKHTPNYNLEETTLRHIKDYFKWKKEWEADEPNRIERQKALDEERKQRQIEELKPFALELHKDLQDSVIYTGEYLSTKLQELMAKYGYSKK